MSEQNGNSDSQQPRNPRNLQGLLKFAMEATKDEDPTKPSHFEQMSPEDKKFLEQALKAVTLDVVEELNKAMEILIKGNASEEDQVQALEVVTNFVADIDTANDFYKIGGFCIILPCLNSEYPEVRSETALLIGELAQNNEFCQRRLLELDVLPKLIELMNDETEVSGHAFHAISCIVRSFEPGMNSFIQMGGLECLLNLIQDRSREKLIIKSMFLMSSFAQDSPQVRHDLIKLNAIEKIVETLEPKNEYSTRLEQTLSALISLVEGEEAIRRCQDENLKLKEKLNQIVSLGNGKEECDEQIEFSQTLLDRIFK
ncbi:CLUMA_CG007945, isoform A [Clunio marinus]|uniref:CLUMA_CG007945, isoform A n=1 Tax=Clunio marinus TaxID=568069 RepID=A0A1J1I678_9DIPT|nr:CLUMA_CG007945, isoform A [Clunio marinus]